MSRCVISFLLINYNYRTTSNIYIYYDILISIIVEHHYQMFSMIFIRIQHIASPPAYTVHIWRRILYSYDTMLHVTEPDIPFRTENTGEIFLVIVIIYPFISIIIEFSCVFVCVYFLQAENSYFIKAHCYLPDQSIMLDAQACRRHCLWRPLRRGDIFVLHLATKKKTHTYLSN